MPARNEDWVLECSLRAALEWCDRVVVIDHASSDWTHEIISEISTVSGRVISARQSGTVVWNEMEMRQDLLKMARLAKGTHIAIIDADEVLTANCVDRVRGWFEALKPGQALEVPMIPVWGDLDHYRDDSSVWSRRNDLGLGFADHPGLAWKPAEDGYEHHHRLPYATTALLCPPASRPLQPGEGGVMHLQFANKRRLLAKHVLYRMVDYLRWPGRDTVEKINWRYDLALDENGMQRSPVPPEWWAWSEHYKKSIKLDGVPWQEAEIGRLLQEHGREAFAGLDLKGF